MRILPWLAVLLLAAGPALADIQNVPGDIAGEDSTATLPAPADSLAGGFDFVMSDELLDRLENEDCRTVAGYAYRAVPYWVVQGDAASLFDFLSFWEVQCGPFEPLQRMWILATIWQAAFDESYYDEDITDLMVDRWANDRESRPALRRDFDDFTVEMADQLLPHQDRDSLEEFWCLFYSGRVAEAWALLDGPDLADTWVRHYRDEEIARNRKKREIPVVMVTGGGWWPGGDVAFAGDKPLVGLLGGIRSHGWLIRGALEMRVGRTTTPYLTSDSDRFGRSNRFDATYLGVELGRIVNLHPRQALDLFLGAGADVVVPYQGEDVTLTGINFNLGAGYRFFAGRYRNWTFGLDLRREWIGERNPGRYSMAGDAWSLRAGVGWSFVKDRNRTLAGLGR